MNGALRAASCTRPYEQAPDRVDADGTRHWLTRARNFVTAISQVKPGTLLERRDNPDESLLVLPPGVAATVEAAGERVESSGDSLTILPPGTSRVSVHSAGYVARVFSDRAADLLVLACNRGDYADGAPEVAPIEPWPAPAGGFRLRHYPLADYDSPDPSPLKMRVFRSTNLMINIFLPWSRRRDETKLSPHSHDDFEQMSLALEGSFVHHMRYPWTADKTSWRDDQHIAAGSPSLLVIPARVVHTSQDVGEGITRLIDIFGPPRLDFSLKPGFVLNAADYPLPASARA
jgi:hypothetical protein